jgi:hypothetical protein
LFRFTFGHNAHDKINGRWTPAQTVTVNTFSDYLDILEAAASVVREPWEKDGHCLLPAGMPPVAPSCPWTGAFLLSPGSRRQKTDLIGIGRLLIADKDDGSWTLAALHALFFEVPHCVHTTTKSRHQAQRLRIILELDREHTVDEFDSLFQWLADLVNGLDSQTRHANRCQFMPSQWTSADNEFVRCDVGTPLPVDQIVAAYPPMIAPVILSPANLTTSVDVVVITDAMIAKEAGQPSGGRLRRILCAAAGRFKAHGWSINPQQLAFEAANASAIISPNKVRRDLQRQADRAIEWATSHVETKPTFHPNIFHRKIS